MIGTGSAGDRRIDERGLSEEMKEVEKDKDGYYVTPEMASKIMYRSLGALANDRWLRKGLPYIKIAGRGRRGGRVLYDRRDIEAFLEDHKIRPTE